MTKEQSANMLDKGMIHFRGWGEWNQKAGRSHSVTQSGAQFKIYELFISEIFFPLSIFILQLTAGHCGKWNLDQGDWLYALAFWFIFLPRPPLQQLLMACRQKAVFGSSQPVALKSGATTPTPASSGSLRETQILQPQAFLLRNHRMGPSSWHASKSSWRFGSMLSLKHLSLPRSLVLNLPNPVILSFSSSSGDPPPTTNLAFLLLRN